MEELKEMHCAPEAPDQSALGKDEIDQYLNRLGTPWEVVDNKRISKVFPFENFKRGVAFCQEIGLLAERENHHPEICIAYHRVKVELYTHAVGGLTLNDFILAAKIDAI
jgi:4a-hydroxytetrahydrobiopterin dehydratase